MLSRAFVVVLALPLSALQPALAQSSDHGEGSHKPVPDSAFVALQDRGRNVMRVDQYTSTHRFDDLPDGGRIELQRDSSDTSGVRIVREHLAGIARAFAAGNFRAPGLVHDQQVPGTATMAARHELIRYEFQPLAGGGEIRITTLDPQALEAVHAFLAFQRREHRSGGAVHTH